MGHNPKGKIQDIRRMKQTSIFLIIGVVMFSFLLLSPYKVWIIILAIFLAAITLGRYLIFKAGQEE